MTFKPEADAMKEMAELRKQHKARSDRRKARYAEALKRIRAEHAREFARPLFEDKSR